VIARRAFVTGLFILLAQPGSVAGQQRQVKIRRIGFLWGLGITPLYATAFEHALGDLGWLNGQNILIEHRSAEGQLDRLPALAAELVSLKPDVIVTVSALETAAVKRATASIPIVFVVHGDPVGSGHVASLAHPGGNITGLTQMLPQLIAKELEILKALVPKAGRVAVLWNAANPAKLRDWEELRPAARSLQIGLNAIDVRSPEGFTDAFASIKKQSLEALFVMNDPLTYHFRTLIANFALKERVPAMYPIRGFVEVGGLMSYGADVLDLTRGAARFVDKVLRGAKPAELPVEQSTKFEFVINLKTAKALGLTIPQSLLVRADEIIQ
jgi:putative ABC transport system substrate-binding protein